MLAFSLITYSGSSPYIFSLRFFLDMSRIDEQSEEIIITRTCLLDVLDRLVLEYCPTVTNKQDFSSTYVNGTVQTFDSCYFHGSAH
jgi:hypothetical protein